jgi:hypothetical protein
MLILAVPVVSAYAEPFAIATNKDIYTPDDKVIVVGVIPDDAPSGYAVLIKVTDSAGGECAAMNVLPGPDNLFISRPVALDCGPGEYSVAAYYADMKANSTFKVSNSRSDSGNKLELRMIKQVVLQAQDAVNLRLKELIEGGYVLPQAVAEKYSSGVSEASLALQAVELGNTADAKKYQIAAIRHFREVINALSDEQVSAYTNREEKVTAEDSSRVLERLERLQEFYSRLKELAEKNGVSMDSEFQTAASMLSQSRQMIDAGDIAGAEQTLEQVNNLLENIRADLYDEEEEESKKSEDAAAAPANSTMANIDEEQARRLGAVADSLEKRAANLQSDDNPQEAAEKIEKAVSLIADARADIAQGDYDSARKVLSEAYKTLSEARRIIESQDDNGGSRGNSGSDDDENNGSNRGSGNDTSGSG